MPPRWPRRVACLALDQVAPFELGVVCEVFGLARPEIRDPWYQFCIAAAEPGEVRTDLGFSIVTPHGLEALERADTVAIPAWRDCSVPPPEPVLDAVVRAHDRGARLVAVCSGVFLLAHAGLIDGRRVTSHWMHTDELAARFPAVKVDPDVLYVDDGDILTSAGTAAGIDLCLHVVRLDLGADAANAVARRMVVPPHRDGGQAQFIETPVPGCAGPDPLTDALDWAVANLGQPLTVESLARRAHMSPRTFARRFRASTGTTPLQWLLRQRILCAQRLLETTTAPVETIAEQCGFGSPAAFRAQFKRFVGVAPLAYRRTFQPRGIGTELHP